MTTKLNIFKKAIIIFVCFVLLDFLIFKLLRTGMTKYYNLTDKAKVLIVGHSHTVLGVDSKVLEKYLGLKVSKYAIAGANVLDRYWMIKHYLDINPDVEIIIYGVDARLFDSEGLSSASYTLFLPFIDNKIMARYLHEQATWEEYYVSKFIKTARFRDQTINISLRGLLNKSENIKTGVVQIQKYQAYLEREKNRKVRINPNDVKCFYYTMNYLSKNSKTVFLVHFPVTDLLNQIDKPNQKKVLNIFMDTDKKHTNIHFLNYLPENESNYNLFFDLRHLNETGKHIITETLSLDIKKYLISRHTQTNTQQPK